MNIPYYNATSYKDVIKANRSSFFSSFFILSKEKAHALKVFYAFSRIIDDCVDEIQDPKLQKQALDYYKDQVSTLEVNEKPQHPVINELKTISQKFKIPTKYYQLIIEGCEMDIHKKTYNDFNELYEYCYRVAGVIGLVCIKIFEYNSPHAEEMAISLGLAFQITNILRDIKTDLNIGRIYLPKEDIEEFGYSQADLLLHKYNKEFHNLMNYYFDKALYYYNLAESEFINDKENKLKAAKIMRNVYKATLLKLKKQNYPVFDKRVSLSKIEKLFQIIKALF